MLRATVSVLQQPSDTNRTLCLASLNFNRKSLLIRGLEKKSGEEHPLHNIAITSRNQRNILKSDICISYGSRCNTEPFCKALPISSNGKIWKHLQLLGNKFDLNGNCNVMGPND